MYFFDLWYGNAFNFSNIQKGLNYHRQILIFFFQLSWTNPNFNFTVNVHISNCDLTSLPLLLLGFTNQIAVESPHPSSVLTGFSVVSWILLIYFI